MNKYRVPIWLLIGVAATIALLSFLGGHRLTIKAGQVVAVPAGTHNLQTSFTIQRARSLETLAFQGWIKSEGHAGACLHANASALIPALSSAQSKEACATGLPDGWAAIYYEGACWVRGLENNYCVKSTVDNNGPYAVGTHRVPRQGTAPAEEMYTEIRRRRGNNSPFSIDWRTFACLNPIDPNTSTTAFTCRPNTPGPKEVRHRGPIATIP